MNLSEVRGFGQARASVLIGLWVIIHLVPGSCVGQESSQLPDAPSAVQPFASFFHDGQENNPAKAKSESTLEKARVPIVWLIGPYIPPEGPLQPLTNSERTEVYFRQTFLTAGSYLARMFTAGIDQARGVPYQWGGGMPGYGRRFEDLNNKDWGHGDLQDVIQDGTQPPRPRDRFQRIKLSCNDVTLNVVKGAAETKVNY